MSVAARAATARAAIRPAWLDVAIVIAPALLIVPFALLRFVDGDEGDYLMATGLVLDGELPYRDFLYTQTPALPYVYAGWTFLFGEEWEAARLLSALLMLGMGALVYRHVARRSGRALGAATLALFSTTGLALAWLTPVKTQGLSTLLLFAAFFTVADEPLRDRRRWLLAGALLGLAIDVRLLVAAAVPAFVWEARREGLRFLAGGLAIGLAPSLAFATVDFGRFAFGILGYHAERSEEGLVGDFEQKARIVANLLGVGTPDGGLPQFLMLGVAAAAGAIAVRRSTGRVPFALVIAACVGVASLAPTPTYAQYFAVVVPFLLVTAGEGFTAARPGPRLTAAVGAFAVLYAGLAVGDVLRYARDHRLERTDGVEQVAAVVQRSTRPGERVLSSWPGYLVGTHARPVAGLENAYAPHEAARFSEREAERYRMASVQDVEQIIRERRVRIVVVKPWHLLPPLPAWKRELEGAGYRVLARVEAASNVEIDPPVTVYEAPR